MGQFAFTHEYGVTVNTVSVHSLLTVEQRVRNMHHITSQTK